MVVELQVAFGEALAGHEREASGGVTAGDGFLHPAGDLAAAGAEDIDGQRVAALGDGIVLTMAHRPSITWTSGSAVKTPSGRKTVTR